MMDAQVSECLVKQTTLELPKGNSASYSQLRQCLMMRFFFTFICLWATTLSYDAAHRTVRSWCQNSFDCFSRWPWNTLRNYMWCRLLQEGVGEKRCTMRCTERGLRGEGGRETVNRTEKESFQQYFYNRFKILHTFHTYCCYAYNFYAYWLYFIYVWHVYVSPKTYTWFGTFIIKDYFFLPCVHSWRVLEFVQHTARSYGDGLCANCASMIAFKLSSEIPCCLQVWACSALWLVRPVTQLKAPDVYDCL
jgi:hypothetical protein